MAGFLAACVDADKLSPSPVEDIRSVPIRKSATNLDEILAI